MTRDRKIGRIGKRYDLANMAEKKNLYTLENIIEGGFYPSQRSEIDRKLFAMNREIYHIDTDATDWLEKKILGSSFTKFKPERIFLIYKIIKEKELDCLFDIIQERMKMFIVKNVFNPKVIKMIVKIWNKLQINYGKMIGEVKYMLTYCKRQSLLDQTCLTRIPNSWFMIKRNAQCWQKS